MRGCEGRCWVERRWGGRRLWRLWWRRLRRSPLLWHKCKPKLKPKLKLKLKLNRNFSRTRLRQRRHDPEAGAGELGRGKGMRGGGL